MNSILDGRSRLKACEMAGVEPRFEYYVGDKTPAEVVYSTNVVRRHLTPIQCALAILELVENKHGGDRKSSGAQRLLKAQKDLCDRHGIKDTMLKETRAVKRVDCPELLNALISGKLSSKRAAAIARDEKAIEAINGGASVEDVAEEKSHASRNTKGLTSQSPANSSKPIKDSRSLRPRSSRADEPFRAACSDTAPLRRGIYR